MPLSVTGVSQRLIDSRSGRCSEISRRPLSLNCVRVEFSLVSLTHFYSFFCSAVYLPEWTRD